MRKEDLLRIIYSKKSSYHDIKVADYGNCRFLLTGQGRARKQSCVNLHNLRDHVLNYSSMLFSSLLFVPEPTRVLIVGLGAGVIPRELVFHIPQVKVDVIEIDPEIVNIAKRFFRFKEGPRLRVIIGDGREIMDRRQIEWKKRYDIIILDAFCGDYVPTSLMTVEIIETVKNMLTDIGVTAANMFNTHQLYSSQVRTFIEVFGIHIYGLRGKRSPGTTILFAPVHQPQRPNGKYELNAAATASRLDLTFELRIPIQMESDKYLRDGNVLRDNEVNTG